MDLKVVEVAGHLAPTACFILPQMSLPFTYSGTGGYQERSTEKYQKFKQQTGINLGPSMGIDCDTYITDWKGAVPKVEVAEVEYYPTEEEIPTIVNPLAPVSQHITWIDLLGESRESMPDKDRRARWEEWKELARKAGDSELVDYWSKDHIDESCAGCIHRDADWCKLAELPCSINPILTIHDGIIGMACMGMGKQSQPVQQSLF